MGATIFKSSLHPPRKSVMKYTLDAQGNTLGRLAAEVASILIGKNSVDYAPNIVADVQVEVVNIDKVSVTGKKMKQKKYHRHSTYPGGLKTLRMEEVVDKKGMAEVLKNAVDGMLPKNKLRKLRIKNLIIAE